MLPNFVSKENTALFEEWKETVLLVFYGYKKHICAMLVLTSNEFFLIDFFVQKGKISIDFTIR